jgi:hypothetical protein
VIIRDFHYLASDLVTKLLPSGVHYSGYRVANRSAYTVCFTDWEDRQLFFKKEYHLKGNGEEVLASILKDAGMFVEKWNSPLMKALR